jgi:hypothetical protein
LQLNSVIQNLEPVIYSRYITHLRDNILGKSNYKTNLVVPANFMRLYSKSNNVFFCFF